MRKERILHLLTSQFKLRSIVIVITGRVAWLPGRIDRSSKRPAPACAIHRWQLPRYHPPYLLLACCVLLLTCINTTVSAGVVLLYHHVDKSTPSLTSISPAQFKRHLEVLEEENFSVVPLDQLVSSSMLTDATVKEVAITFDDAYSSIYTTAFPLLKAKGWPFTIFVATAYIGRPNSHYMTWEHLNEMAKNGATIANHTRNHEHLIRYRLNETDAMWEKRMISELQMTSDILSDHGHQSKLFAYPYGEYNLSLLRIVKKLGLIAFGQQSGAIGPASNRQLLPRFPLAGVYVGESAFRDKIRSLPLAIEHPEIEPLVSGNLQPALNLTFTNKPEDAARIKCYGPGGEMTLLNADGQVIAKPVRPIAIGRTRYNCTLPIQTAGGTRYGWFSQLWIRKEDDGTWYPEP